jgi:hypothetical protein
LLIPDERCHPHHGAHMLTSSDLKGTKKSLCSPSREITGTYGWQHADRKTRYAISQRILLLLLIPDERCHPHHGAHMLTSLDLKGIKKSLCSPSREITGLYGRTHIEF